MVRSNVNALRSADSTYSDVLFDTRNGAAEINTPQDSPMSLDAVFDFFGSTFAATPNDILDSMPRAGFLSAGDLLQSTGPSASAAGEPSYAFPGGSDAEISFIAGVTSTGQVAATSFATWNGDNAATYSGPAYLQKWGSSTIGTGGGTVTYWFDTASAWTAVEKSAFTSCLSLWSAVANVSFAPAVSQSAASFYFQRGTDGSAYFTDTGSDATIGGATTGAVTPGSAYISIDTSVPGFGPIGDSFDKIGGYPWETAVHEIGHLLGLGHGGAYNGNVNPATQQFSAFDTRLWSLMSYIEPTTTTAQYYGSYPVTGTNWGFSSDFYRRDPVTPMMLDIQAIQRLYGAQSAGPLAGGQTFGFNTNISASIRNFFDFTINSHPVITIWDSGLNNTLDASGFATANTISLVDGTFSSLSGQINNVGIASGTVVETAIGGSGVDTITGSALNNTIRGNAGNDIINGGLGVDTSVYTVTRTASSIARNLDGTVTINAGANGVDTLTNVEWAQFTDARAWVGAQRNDANNDGRSDLLWQNASGQAAIWELSGASIVAAAALVNPGPTWKLVGSGDFNGDRKADLIWQNTDGLLAEWQMNGTAISTGIVLGNPGSTARATCIGDFNGDGYSDIAMQDSATGAISIWDMNGGAIVGAGVAANPGTSWHLAAAADFNADGSADLLFQNNDGSVAIWQMNGPSIISGAVLAANPGTSWHIKGTGDFNNDGKADIVWQHNDGTIAIWSMQNATTLITGPMTGIVGNPGAAFKVGAVGDFNGDSVADLMMQNTTTGQVALWAMNGSSLSPFGSAFAENPGTTWQLVA